MKESSSAASDLKGRWPLRFGLNKHSSGRPFRLLGGSVSSSFNNLAESAPYLHSDVTSRINSAAIAAHRALGPGYLEAIYEEALCVELDRQEIVYERQRSVRVRYEGVPVGLYRQGLVVEGKVVVEVKAVAGIDRAHLATMFSYLKATGLAVGLIINISCEVVRIRRVFRGSDGLKEEN